MSPRPAGSWPGYPFTGPPLKLPDGHVGLSHVEFLHELATIR